MPLSSSVCSRVAAAGLACFGLFQCCLAVGLPWGTAAYGGAHPGVLPTPLRLSSAVATVAYAGLAAAVATQVGRPATRRVGLTALAVVMAGGAILNLISPAPQERWWAALCAVVAASAWLARPVRD